MFPRDAQSLARTGAKFRCPIDTLDIDDAPVRLNLRRSARRRQTAELLRAHGDERVRFGHRDHRSAGLRLPIIAARLPQQACADEQRRIDRLGILQPANASDANYAPHKRVDLLGKIGTIPDHVERRMPRPGIQRALIGEYGLIGVLETRIVVIPGVGRAIAFGNGFEVEDGVIAAERPRLVEPVRFQGAEIILLGKVRATVADAAIADDNRAPLGSRTR